MTLEEMIQAVSLERYVQTADAVDALYEAFTGTNAPFHEPLYAAQAVLEKLPKWIEILQTAVVYNDEAQGFVVDHGSRPSVSPAVHQIKDDDPIPIGGEWLDVLIDRTVAHFDRLVEWLIFTEAPEPTREM